MSHPSHARSLAASCFVALSSLALSSLALTAPARAECAPLAPDVLWSYPSAGQLDVPTDATLWLRLSRVGSLTVTLNDRPLPFTAVDVLAPDEPGRILEVQPEALEPNTDYVLRVIYGAAESDEGDAGARAGDALSPRGIDGGADAADGGAFDDAHAPPPPGSVLTLPFRTGAQAAPLNPSASTEVAAASVDLFGIAERVAQHPCRPLIEAQGCFADSLLKSLTLDVQSEGALAWLILGPEADDSQLWPARCGAPLLFMRAEVTDLFGVVGVGLAPQCYEVRALLPGGALGDPASFCTDASEPITDAGAPREHDAGVADAGAVDAGATGDAPSGDAGAPSAKRRDDDGCALARESEGGAAAWFAGALAILSFARRRSRRGRAHASSGPDRG